MSWQRKLLRSLSRSFRSSIVLYLIASGPALRGQQAPPAEPEHDVNAMAKQTQNPVGDIISIPFQFNFNNGGGLRDATLFNLNIQPVIPIKISKDWTFISRTIIPIDSFPGPDTTRYAVWAISQNRHSLRRPNQAK
jgi:hypothetical protein